MRKIRFSRLPLPFLRGGAKATKAIVVGCVLLGAVVSCKTVTRHVVVLPQMPEAKYVGSKECEQCHEDIYRDFATADHARLITAGPNALEAGCESCHGPSSVHAESGGETKPPFAFSSGRSPSAGLGARPMLASARSVENVCFSCHGNVRGQFNLPNHHPVPEGRMTCTECHSPHKGAAHTGANFVKTVESEACLRCHQEQRGPHTFEHEAMREGCTTCHGAHGTVNAKMLNVRDSNLCLRCHFQQVRNGAVIIGGSDHSRLDQGTCWTAGCHEAVHGSRVNSSLRF
jgi:predicted CXXCH cytochrome family protein